MERTGKLIDIHNKRVGESSKYFHFCASILDKEKPCAVNSPHFTRLYVEPGGKYMYATNGSTLRKAIVPNDMKLKHGLYRVLKNTKTWLILFKADMSNYSYPDVKQALDIKGLDHIGCYSVEDDFYITYAVLAEHIMQKTGKGFIFNPKFIKDAPGNYNIFVETKGNRLMLIGNETSIAIMSYGDRTAV